MIDLLDWSEKDREHFSPLRKGRYVSIVEFMVWVGIGIDEVLLEGEHWGKKANRVTWKGYLDFIYLLSYRVFIVFMFIFFVIDCFSTLPSRYIFANESNWKQKIRKINQRVIVIESIISIGILVCNKHSRLVNPLLSWSFVINTWCNFFTDLIECASRDSVSAFSFVYCRWPVDRLTEVSVFRSPTFPVREINHPHAVICDFYSYKLF